MRKLATGTGVLSITLIILNLILYKDIPQVIPVLRGIEAEKTLLLSIRVLAINILTLATFLILSNSLYRAKRGKDLIIYGKWILGFIMFKMVLEFIGLFYARFFALQMYFLLAGIVLLLLYGLSRHRYLFCKKFWYPVRFLASEKIVLVIFLLVYIVLQIPVVSIVLNH